MNILSIHSIIAQEYSTISLEQAIEIATKQDPSLILAELNVMQSDKQAKVGLAFQPTQISLSGEEFNFDGISGVQSLNIQQNFYMPGVSEKYKAYNRSKSKKYAAISKLTKKEVVRNVESAYYRLAIAKQELSVRQNAKSIYVDFLERSKESYRVGESNKIAMVTAENMLKKAELNIDHTFHEIEMARSLFNIWLGNTGRYDVQTISTEYYKVEYANQPKDYNTHLSIYDLEKEVIERNVDIQKSNLLPQINTGVRLQSLNGDLLYFGYQIGANIPLGRGSYKRQMEATKVGLGIVDAEKAIKKREIDLRIIKLTGHLEHLGEKLEAYETDLTPSILKQIDLLKEAYQAGEGNYIEYLMTIESYDNLQLEKVQLLEDYYQNLVELKYWTSIN